MPYFPTETGCNWATIATGATPARHGCKYSIHIPGTPLGKAVPGFSSKYCKAEQIWQVVDKLNELSIVIDYPQSYPINARNIVHIGEDGYPGPNSCLCIRNAHAYISTDIPKDLPAYLRTYLTKIKIKRIDNWANVPLSKGDSLEAEIPIKTREEKLSFYILVERNNNEYDKVSLFSEKDYNKKLGEARKGMWSNWIEYKFKLYGKYTPAYFRFKVIKLSSDGKELHLYFTQIYPKEGWSYPSELARELVEKLGPYLHRPTEQALVVSGASDVETFIQEEKYQAHWYAKVASYLLMKYNWRLFMMKWHGPDFFEHFTLHLIDPSHPLFDPSKEKEEWDLYAEFYKICDDLIASVLNVVDDDNTIIAVVSDHGHVANVVYHIGNEVLEKAGLLHRRDDGSIDWSRTKTVFLAEGIWINLKGRDPQGIVEPGEEYEEVRDEVINLLLDLKDPRTGKPVFSLVCRREEAKILGREVS